MDFLPGDLARIDAKSVIMHSRSVGGGHLAQVKSSDFMIFIATNDSWIIQSNWCLQDQTAMVLVRGRIGFISKKHFVHIED